MRSRSGAQLDAAKSEEISAEAGYLGVKAGGAAEVSESLAKKYCASDDAMMAIIKACDSAANVSATKQPTGNATAALVAHWKFDEEGGVGAADVSANGNNGELQGGGKWVPGRTGGALRLEDKQWVLVKEQASLHSPRAMTIAGWFLATELPEGPKWRSIIHKGVLKGEMNRSGIPGG